MLHAAQIIVGGLIWQAGTRRDGKMGLAGLGKRKETE